MKMIVIARIFLLNIFLLSILLFKDVYGDSGIICETPKATYNRIIFEKLGCWEDTGNRTLDFLGNFYNDPLYNCYINSKYKMFEIFSIQYGHECYAGNGLSYQRFGRSNRCHPNGTGGDWSNEVYKVNKNRLDNIKTAEFRNVLKENCTSLKITATNSASDSCNKGCSWSNSVGINEDECYICTCDTIWNLGENVFRCDKNCHKPQLNFTYNGVIIEKHGCWKDGERQTLATLEGTSPVLDVYYKNRIDPFGKCYKVAAERGYKYFALQNGGYCSAGNNESYKQLGISTDCKSDGEGGSWANEVYKININSLVINDVIRNGSFLYFTCNINCWNLDKPAVNVTWEYLFPPFKTFQSANTSLDVSYSSSSGFQYKVMNLPFIGVNQTITAIIDNTSITAIIDNTSYFACQIYIDIPIKLYFKSSAGLSWKSSQTIRQYLTKSCHIQQNSSLDFDECSVLNKPCNWTNSVCMNTNGSYICTCEAGWLLDKNNKSCVGQWSAWSECSQTCGFGDKYSVLNESLLSKQEVKRRESCMISQCPVDGSWNNWSDWINYVPCSHLCGICFTRKERSCNKTLPAFGGRSCFGINIQYSDNNTICPVDGGWGQWSPWSLCNQPCQYGVEKRYRSCTNPLPKYGGLHCNGNNTDQKTCYSDECKEVTVNFGMTLLDDKLYSTPNLEYNIQTAIQNLYKKLNKNIKFNLTLNSIRNKP